MTALFGILQLDRGDPWGYAQVPGLVQAWLQDAGGFAAAGLVVYLLYALTTPTDKSESERLRVRVTKFMLAMGAVALVLYALYFVLIATGKGAVPQPPPPLPGEIPKPIPPQWRTELQPIVLSLAGLCSLLGIGHLFAIDFLSVVRRNVSFNLSGVRRFGGSLKRYTGELGTKRRLTIILGSLAAYGALGALLFALDVPRFTGIWLGVLVVGVGVTLAALFLLMLFEAEGPMWAIAKLSFKEAVRSQVLWIFLLVFLPVLFPVQWFAGGKPSDEMRTTTAVATLVLSVLVLIPAGLIASFGIPNDIKNWNIFTVVSKPVERFEIVSGRFVGYLALMTLVTLALTGVSLVFVMNNSLSDRARAETYTARVPHRGKLDFKSIVGSQRNEKKEFEGTNVGREFDYRKYIAGAPISPHRAIWHFATLPGSLASAPGDRVPVEFTFDIFKLTKGEQNKGVVTKFVFVTHNVPLKQPARDTENGEWRWENEERRRAYDKRAAELRAAGTDPLNQATARPNAPGGGWGAVNKLAEEFGYYEINGKEVFDYQVMGVEVPAGLFRNAAQGDPGKGPRFSVYVKCESEGQLLGAAEPDLYLLESEMPFWFNFLKAGIGLWCRLCIVVGLAVVLSTYQSGILNVLAVGTIFLIGFFTDHLSEVANNRNAVGGGPLQSLSQIFRAEQPTAPLSDSATTKAIQKGDQAVAWLIRRVQNMIPDVESFSWEHFVGEGFNVNGEYLVLNLIVTFGYLIPWFIFGYYMMKLREVAA
jgi:ABC-type transport system involved in multi-copper enzyme maturation permease subunit